MPARYDPFQHHRKSIRYANWDYRSPGFYFITVCTAGRKCLFDNLAFAEIVEIFWRQIPNQKTAQHVKLDAFIVMPNHVHFILYLVDYPAGYVATDDVGQFRAPPPGSVGAIVGQYKSVVSRAINNLRDGAGNSVWQRGYWDRIIRNEDELNKTRHYIATNPKRWADNQKTLDTLLQKMTYHK